MGKNNKFSLTTKSHSSTRVNPYDKITMNALNVSCPDKSVVLPKLDSNSAQLFSIELYSLFIFVIALGTQYLNLYRSVWWLSSRTTQAINYHLIDSDVSEFSLLFIGQSSLISILKALFNGATIPAKYLQNPLAIATSSSAAAANTTTTATAASSSTTTTSSGSNNHNNHNHNNHISSTSTSPTNSTNSLNHNNNHNHSLHQTASAKSNNHQQQQASNNSHHHHHNHHQQQQQQQPSSSSSSTLATVISALASWICNYYLLKCAYRIWSNFGFNGLSCVSYPIVISIILNSTHIIQVFESCRKNGKLNLPFLSLSMTIFSFHIRFDDDKLCHNCSNQPDEIRDEVERLRTIFNERLKSAYHFGKWQRLEARNTLMPCINWSENVIYPQGVVVKHYRGYFRSESVSNCAQPGVSSHLRYYIVFSNPKIGYAAVLGLLGLLLVAQMYLLLMSTEWYKLIAMTNMMLINFHSIFRLVKSLVVITKIYKGKH